MMIGRARLAAISALGAAALGLLGAGGAWIWLHRVDLIEIPAAWREVQHILEHGPQSREERYGWGHVGLDNACARLLSMQDAGFWSCDEFHLTGFRSRGGEIRTLGWCTYQGGILRLFLFVLDARGRLLDHRTGPDPGPSRADDPRVRVSTAGFDVLRFESGDPLVVWEYSVDTRGGVVPHGLVTVDDLAAPVNSLSSGGIELRWFFGAMGRGHREDILRALDVPEGANPMDLTVAEPFLSHADEEIRARAASVYARSPPAADRLTPLLADPSPRVRLAAGLALAKGPRREESLSRLVPDPDPRVARWAAFMKTLAASSATPPSAGGADPPPPPR